MLPTVWSEQALSDSESLVAFIGEQNPRATRMIRNLIVATAEKRGHHPYAYREGRIAGTREAIVHPHYILVYRMDLDAIRVVNVLHASQRYPSQ